MPTLNEVAQKAGVSTATVSKVLSNTPYFSEATRQKVMQAVEELGYRPNLAARALSKGKTHVIGVVFPYIYDRVFTDPLVQRILEGVEGECSQRGYNLLLSTPQLAAQGPDENYLRLLHSGYVDGLVALDNVPVASVLEPARARNVPAVAIGYQPHAYYVHSDDHQGGQGLMEYILGLGHRHIGVITVRDGLNYSIRQRIAGLQTAAEAAGLNFAELPQIEGRFSLASGAECARTLLEQHPQITALACMNDRMALGALHYAREAGIAVPAALSVVGYDDISSAQHAVPPLTTINQQALQLGRMATRMLFELLDQTEPASVVLPTELIIRASAAPPVVQK
ncbi:MAG: LacI family transcriptional regulator [Anaerolineae bacterium]|nr:LacI family transcriptional regulator [Anaerolineae bacterium]